MANRKKKPTDRVLIERLLLSKTLNPGERAAFEAMSRSLDSGAELTEHQQLWVEYRADRL